MDIYVRLIVTYWILLIGSQVVYFGMKFNGSASSKNPVWNLVDGFHSIITYGSLAAAGYFVVVQFLAPLVVILADEISKYLEQRKELKPIEYPKIELSSEQRQEAEKQHLEWLEKRRKEEEQRFLEQQRIEAKKLEYEELQKKKIIEERRRRTADEVTRSALDDFL